MATKTNKSLTHDPDHYVKVFRHYAEVTGKFKVYASWADRVFGEKILPKFNVELGENEELRVLGIGSGSGEMDVKMLTKLKQCFPRIDNRVVEPAGGHIEMFKALVQSQAHELHGVNFEWRQQTMDEYEAREDTTMFHFVHAVQSLCYVNDLDRTVKYLYDLVEPGGVFLTTINSEKCQHSLFWEGVPSLQDEQMKQLTAAGIRDSLDRQGIPFEDYSQASRIDITKCFDPSSEEGAFMIDMLTGTTNFRETVSADFQVKTMRHLADCSEKCGDSVFLSNDWNALVSSKPKE